MARTPLDAFALWLAPVLAGASAAQEAQPPRPYVAVQEVQLAGPPASEFGSAVAVSGARMVVGAQRGAPGGAAYVYLRDGTTWTQEAKLAASDGLAGDLFGASAAIDGDLIVVGASEDDHPALGVSFAGSAYVYERDASGWSQRAKLVASDVEWFDRFGTRVAIASGKLLVAATGDSHHGPRSGSVYVFARQGSGWVEAQRLEPSDAATEQHFGFSMAPAEDFVLIGGIGTFGAYEFADTGSGFVQRTKLEIPHSSIVTLGYSVARSGDWAVLGAPFDGLVGTARVFLRAGGQWTFVDTLAPAVPPNNAKFGTSAHAEGDALLIGGNFAAYLFARSGGAWTERLKLAHPLQTYGWSTRISGGRLHVGGLTPGMEVLRAAPAPVAYCTGKVNSLGCLPAVGSSGLASASADAGFAVRAVNVRNQRAGTLLYSVAGRAALPFQGGVLCLAPPVRRTPPRSSGGSALPVPDCSGVWRIDWNAFTAGAIGGKPDPAARMLGTVVHCQWWGREPGDPSGSALTDSLQFVTGP